MNEKTHIRETRCSDADSVRRLYMATFDESEREDVAELAVDLLAEKSDPPTFGLVAESEDALLAHIGFSPVWLDERENFVGYILAPLGVTPSCHSQGIGSKLIEHGMQRLKDTPAEVLLVYGDPQYYSRFGFDALTAERFIAPYPLEYPFGWQGLNLGSTASTLAPSKISCVASLSDAKLW